MIADTEEFGAVRLYNDLKMLKAEGDIPARIPCTGDDRREAMLVALRIWKERNDAK